MTAARPVFAAVPDILAVFEARAWARALLWREGVYGLREAVDVLQHDAERNGLVARLGQNEVQQILAEAFHTLPAAAVVPDPPIEQPCHHRAAASTIEALMFSLRQRGEAALAERQCQHRLADLSTQQVRTVIARLMAMRPRYRAISDDLLFQLGKLL